NSAAARGVQNWPGPPPKTVGWWQPAPSATAGVRDGKWTRRVRRVQPAPERPTDPERPSEEVAAHVSDRSTPRSSPGPAGPDRSRGDQVRAYVALTKPRIVELLLVTTVPTLFLAAGGWPGLWLTVATMIGGYAAAGSANT